MDQDDTSHGGGPGPGHIVLDGEPVPLPKKGAEQGGRAPNFRPIFIVAKRLDASRCQLVWRWASAQATLCSMGTQVPPEQSAHPLSPSFWPMFLWPNGWMDEDATWYGSRTRPRPHCIRRGPSSARKGQSSPHLFGPCLLWPRSPISATAELLLYYAVALMNIEWK